jgi:hypothetical protein
MHNPKRRFEMTLLSLKSIALTMGTVAFTMLAGCYKIASSENTKTREIFAELKVVATSDKLVTVEATLKLGGPGSDTLVNLAVDDSLVASVGTDSKVMNGGGFLDDGLYTAKFSNTAENTEFTIGLLRNREGDEQAPSSTGTLPAPFTLGALKNFSRSQEDFTITWDPSGSDDTMHLQAVNNTDCPLSFDADLSGDSGSYTFPKGSLKAATMNPEACHLNIELTRTRKGSADSHYARGSSLTLSQVRSGVVSSTP